MLFGRKRTARTKWPPVLPGTSAQQVFAAIDSARLWFPTTLTRLDIPPEKHRPPRGEGSACSECVVRAGSAPWINRKRVSIGAIVALDSGSLTHTPLAARF